MAVSDYFLQYQITAQSDMRVRWQACVATEADRAGLEIDPEEWADAHRWDYAVTPGWTAAVASAVAAGNDAWPSDGTVITDAMILGRTQQLMGIGAP
jgi:hypothetical protein